VAAQQFELRPLLCIDELGSVCGKQVEVTAFDELLRARRQLGLGSPSFALPSCSCDRPEANGP